MKALTMIKKLLWVAALTLCAWNTQAQDYPHKMLTLVTPFPPGGTTDAVARPLALQLQKRWKQTVIVENKGGAGGSLGTGIVARAPADGYTALLVFDTHAVNPLIYKKLSFDTFADFKGVSQIVSMPMLLVAHPSLSAKSIKELVALAKADPGGLSYASAGAGSSNQLAMELFTRAAGIKMTHVPYRGGGPAISDLLAGHVPMIAVSQPLVLEHVRAGKLKALAVMGKTRSAAMPDLPTMAEQGYPDIDVSSWIGMLVPAATPDVVVKRLHLEVVKATQSKEFQDQMNGAGFMIKSSLPAEFDAFIKGEYERWKPVVRDLKIVVD